MRDVAAIDRALAGHRRMRARLVEQRRLAPCFTPRDEDVDEVRAELDACIAVEDARIEALLDERCACMVGA